MPNCSISMDGIRRNMRIAYQDVLDAVTTRNEDGTFSIGIDDDDELRKALDELRTIIATFHCVYDEGTEHFSDMSDETTKMDWIDERIGNQCEE